MKTAQDFRRALGPADAGFEAAMAQALSRLQKEEKPVKKKMSLSLALALALLAFTLGTALAAGMGVFGQLSQQHQKLGVIEENALENHTTIVLSAGERGEIPVSFSIQQSFYDGERLYVSYALDYEERTVCADVPEHDLDETNFVDFWGADQEEYRPELEKLGVYEELMRIYQEKGRAGVIRDTAYVGDGMTGGDGTYLELQGGDDVAQDGRMIGFREFATPLPSTLQNQPEITLHATVYRSRIYYLLTAEGLYQWADPNREKTDVAVTVARNGETQQLAQAAARFADYQADAQLTQSGGMLICEITVSGMPDSWTSWEDWAQVEADGLDFVDGFRLYADGNALTPLAWEGEGGDTLFWRYSFRLPENAVGVYSLRPVYSLSGERAAEEIRLSPEADAQK